MSSWINSFSDIIQIIANISTSAAVIISALIFVYQKRRELKIQAVKAGISVERIVIQWSYVDMVLKESFPKEYKLLIGKDYSFMKCFDAEELNSIFSPYERKAIDKLFIENSFNTRNIGSPQLIFNVKKAAVLAANKRYENIVEEIAGKYVDDEYLHIFHRIVIDTFNKIETLCVMIKSNVADEHTVFTLVGASLCNYIKSTYYYIVKTNEQYKLKEKKLQNTISVFNSYVRQLNKAERGESNMHAKNLTGYPSIDKTHLKGVKFFERHPIIPNLSISNAIDLMFAFKGSTPVFDCLDLKVNHKQFREDAQILAKAFLCLGVKPGDILAVSMPNLYQSVAIFKAANRIGVVVTFLNPYASDDEILRYLAKYNSPILINYDKSPTYNEKIKSASNVRYIITLSADKVNDRNFEKSNSVSDTLPAYLSYHDLGMLASRWNKRVKTNFGGKQDALILYTSGSTGEPKSLLFTNQNLLAALLYLKSSTHQKKTTKENRRWMGVVPFMYPYGFCCSILVPIFVGGEAVLAPDINPNNIAIYYAKEPYLIFGSPAFLELSKRNLPDDLMFPSLKLFVSGGDFLSVSQSKDGIEFFAKHGATVEICNGSGNGETLGCSTNSMNVPYRPKTVGQLVVGPKYVVLDPETKEEVKYGEPGILCTSGKHVFKGYYNDPEGTENTMITFKGKRYYYTGNYGILDTDRYFTMIGRASRFYITGTLNKVYCELIQNVVCGIDVVDACAVVPKPDKESLFQSKAYVVLKPGIEASSETEKYIIEKSMETYFNPVSGENITLKQYEAPASITFMDKLPRTDSAEKINYELLRKMAEDEFKNEIGE